MPWEFLVAAAAFVVFSGLLGRIFRRRPVPIPPPAAKPRVTLDETRPTEARVDRLAATLQPMAARPGDVPQSPPIAAVETVQTPRPAAGITLRLSDQNSRVRPQTRLIGKPRSLAPALLSTSRRGLKVLGQRMPA